MNELDIFSILYDKFVFTYPPRLFEAFSGIGCQRMALNRLGVPYTSVGISEIDKYAIASYNAIHGETKNYGDITKMKEIPPCDIFTWSFPCTDLSKAGKRKGLQNGTRSGLVYEVLRLLKDSSHRPQVLIMENVPDLVQEKFYREFHEIMNEIESYGYQNYVQRLNGKDYGVAQNRDRVFMVSILGEYSYSFPSPFPLEKRLRDYLEDEVDEKYYLSEKAIKFFQENSKANEEKGNGFRFKPQDDSQEAFAITMLAGHRMDDNFVEEYIGVGVHPNSKKMEFNGFHDTVCPTLLATDYKAPKCIEVIGSLQKNAYKGTLDEPCPTLNSAMGMGGGQTPCIREPILKQIAQISGEYESSNRVYSSEGLCQTINTMGGGNREPKIAEPICLNSKVDGKQPSLADRIYDTSGTSTAITTCFMPSILIPEDTKQGYAIAEEGDGVYINRPHQKRGVVQKGMIQTLKAGGQDVGVVAESRIRKLTPRECWRLMGIDDSDFDKAQAVCSNSQLYKQAGNGIIVDVFAEILRGLFPQKENIILMIERSTNESNTRERLRD